MADSEAAGRPALLAAQDIVAGYIPEVPILNGCDLDLYDGELVGIIGPNGAGKSTLVKALFGLLTVTSGSIKLRDDDITGRPAHDLVSAGLGYVPQNANVFPSLTVDENLDMGSYLRRDIEAARRSLVIDIFPTLGDRLGQRAGSLSGGERQMLAMARALMTEPSVLLLDEPSAGLSPAIQDEVFARIEGINATGVSIVMVEQNARHCLRLCDRAYVLDQGRNAYTGIGEELLHDPKVIELYLGTLARGH
jgi:branched-chain amino acid transport system ATP-binding protein